MVIMVAFYVQSFAMFTSGAQISRMRASEEAEAKREREKVREREGDASNLFQLYTPLICIFIYSEGDVLRSLEAPSKFVVLIVFVNQCAAFCR